MTHMDHTLQAARHEPQTAAWRDLALLCALSIPFLFWGLGLVGFLDPDEGLYGSIAREMAAGGDWITPHFNGVRYLEKPPLEFWLSALTIVLFGPSEWAVRLWSALPAFGTALLIWRMGSRLYGRREGLLAAVVFMSSVGVFRYARVAATDFLLVFSVTLALYGFLKAYLSWSMVNGQQSTDERQRELDSQQSIVNSHSSNDDHVSQNTGLLLFYLGMALGVMAKGIIGLVFPVMIVAVFLLIANSKWQMANRKWSIVNGYWSLVAIKKRITNGESRVENGNELPGGNQQSTVNGQWGWKRTIDDLRLTIYSPAGVLLFLIIVLPWHILAAWKNPGFFQFYIVDNQFLRFLNSRAFLEDDVPIRTLSFLIITLIWFFPWSLFLPAAIREGFSRDGGETSPSRDARMLVGIWALGVLGFFCLSTSKLEHYSLPAIPALSLMVGGRWGREFGKSVNSQWKIVNDESRVVQRQGARLNDYGNGLTWCLGVGAVGCAVVGGAVLMFGNLLTPRVLLAGLAELNVYYRILLDQGVLFPFLAVIPLRELIKELGIVLLVGLPLSFVFFQIGRARLSFFTLLAQSALIGVFILRLLIIIEPYHSSKRLAQIFDHRSGGNGKIVHEGSLEYSAGLPFYIGREIYVLNGQRGDLDFGSRYPETRHLFLDYTGFVRLWRSGRPIFLVTRPMMGSGILAALPPEKLHLVGHYGPRWMYSNRRLVDRQIQMAAKGNSQ